MAQFLLLVTVAGANVAGGAMALPQALRLRRNKDAAGVAPAWAVISAVANGWWVLYGLGNGNAGVIPVAAFSVAVYVTIAATLWRLHGDGRTQLAMLTVGTLLMVLPLPVLVSGGWVAVGVLLGAMYGIQLAPAVVRAYRADETSGISATTWTLALVEALMFGIYGLAVADAGVLALAVCGTAGSTALLIRLRGPIAVSARRGRSAGPDLSPLVPNSAGARA